MSEPMEGQIKSNAKIDAKSQLEITELLQQVNVFSVLTDDQRAQLAEKARLVAYGAGEYIVRKGEHGKSLFIIYTGVCEVFVMDQQGYGKRVAETKRGGFFGEMSLLTGDPHTATVRALEDTTLVAIDKVVFASILEANPEISEELGRVLSERQNELSALVGKAEGKTSSSSNIIARMKSFFKIG